MTLIEPLKPDRRLRNLISTNHEGVPPGGDRLVLSPTMGTRMNREGIEWKNA